MTHYCVNCNSRYWNENGEELCLRCLEAMHPEQFTPPQEDYVSPELAFALYQQAERGKKRGKETRQC